MQLMVDQGPPPNWLKFDCVGELLNGNRSHNNDIHGSIFAYSSILLCCLVLPTLNPTYHSHDLTRHFSVSSMVRKFRIVINVIKYSAYSTNTLLLHYYSKALEVSMSFFE